MVRCVRVVLVIAAGSGLTGLPPVDEVRVTNCGSNEVGLLAWGQLSGGKVPAQATGACGANIPVGDVQPDPNGGNQVAAFTVGKQPAIMMGVNWNAAGAQTVVSSGPLRVPVKFWVLYTRSDCNFSCVETFLLGFLNWANQFLERERSGIVLQAGTGGLVSNQTNHPDTAVSRYVDVSINTECGQAPLSELQAKLSQNGALNIYWVRTVRGRSREGHTCGEPNLAFVASRAEEGTILHEIGHNLSLSHTDGLASFNSQNLMWKYSSVRAFVTEGQVFRMHFEEESALIRTIQSRIAFMRSCQGEGPPDKPCPPLETRLWPDQ